MFAIWLPFLIKAAYNIVDGTYLTQTASERGFSRIYKFYTQASCTASSFKLKIQLTNLRQLVSKSVLVNRMLVVAIILQNKTYIREHLQSVKITAEP